MICENCHKEIPDRSLFCTYCGEKTVRNHLPEVSSVSETSIVPEVSSVPAVSFRETYAEVSDRLMLASKIVLWIGIVISIILSIVLFIFLPFAGALIGLAEIGFGFLSSWILSLFLESRAELLKSTKKIEQLLEQNQSFLTDRKESVL